MTESALELKYPFAGDYAPVFALAMKFTVLTRTFLGLGLFRILSGV